MNSQNNSQPQNSQNQLIPHSAPVEENMQSFYQNCYAEIVQASNVYSSEMQEIVGHSHSELEVRNFLLRTHFR